MMKLGSLVAVFAAWCMVVLVAAQLHGAAAVTCDPAELKSCLPAITSRQSPSAECCSKLKEQVPCFCKYLKNPALKPYIDNPNTKKLPAACGVRPPICPHQI